MSHTILVVDAPGGACFERVVSTVKRASPASFHVGTAEEVVRRVEAAAGPAVAIITSDTPAPLAVGEQVYAVAPLAHILFVADETGAAALATGLRDSAVSQGARWAISPPDDDRIVEFLACALGVSRRLKTAAQGREPASGVDVISAAADRLAHMVWSAAADGTVDYYNAEWERVLGLAVADLSRHGWMAFSHDADRPRVRLAWERAVSTGGHFQVETRLRAGGGQWSWCRLEARQGGEGQDAGRWYGDCVLLRAPQSLENSWRFLSEVARRITGSLDYESTLSSLAQAVVPTFADWCAVDVVNDAGGLDRASLSHTNPDLVRAIVSRRPDVEVSRWTALDVVRTGEPQLITHIDQAMIDSAVQDPQARAFFASLKLRSLIRLPLKARGRTVGVITFVLSGPGTRRYTQEDLPLATEIAQQGAIAVENARLYRKAREEIEERRRAEEALATSEARYRSLIEASAQIVWSLDAEGRARDDLPGWRAFTGQSPNDVVGYGWMEALHPRDRESLQGRFPCFGPEAQAIVLQADLASADGGYRSVVLRIVPLFDKEGCCREWIAAGIDITREKTANELLAREKEQLAVTLNSLGEAVVTMDTAGHITLFNHVAQTLTGWPQREALGQLVDEVVPLHDVGSGQRLRDIVGGVLRQDEQPRLGERRLLRARDGSERMVVYTAALIREPAGRSVGAVAVFRDITAHQRLEEDALKAQKLESVGVLAGGIAHDFNNILTAVIGNIALAKMLVPGVDRVNHALSEAEKAAWRARGLTQQLLTFARGGAPVKREGSLAVLLREAVPFALAGSKAKCHVVAADDLWTIAFDPGQLSQAISNLVINAAQAMPSGGIIHIEARNAEIAGENPHVLPPGPHVRILVADTGNGIPKAHLAKIFDPYFTTREGHSGLGLATTYSIIRRHGGVIRVESEEGRGTQFEVYLPAQAAPIAPAKPAPRRHQRDRILILDDEPALLTLLAALLDHLGYETSAAQDGAQAVADYAQALREGRPFAAVILDLTVAAGVGGEECLRRLQSLDPDVRAIVSSGYCSDPIMADFARFGFRAAITKPYQLHELEEAIHGVLVENGEHLR